MQRLSSVSVIGNTLRLRSVLGGLLSEVLATEGRKRLIATAQVRLLNANSQRLQNIPGNLLPKCIMRACQDQLWCTSTNPRPLDGDRLAMAVKSPSG